jgi:hypothetical protein
MKEHGVHVRRGRLERGRRDVNAQRPGESLLSPEYDPAHLRMQPVRPDHQVETTRTGPLEPHLDTRPLVVRTYDRVPVQDLDVITDSADQDGGQVAAGNLDRVRIGLSRDPPDDLSDAVDDNQSRDSVAATRRDSSTPSRATTSSAAPRTSTGPPVERWSAARSTSVVATPLRASSTASVEPAIPAPTTNPVRTAIEPSIVPQSTGDPRGHAPIPGWSDASEDDMVKAAK